MEISSQGNLPSSNFKGHEASGIDVTPEGEGFDLPRLSDLWAAASITKGEETLPDASIDPGGAFRFLFDVWVERGGYKRGKPRHSVRKIKSWLGDSNEVRSLETKLAGKTPLRFDDALRLVTLFLERWTYNEENRDYSAFCSDSVGVAAKSILMDIYKNEEESLRLPLRTRDQIVRDVPCSPEMAFERKKGVADAQRSRSVIEGLFQSSSALITISRERTIIGSNPSSLLVKFQQLMASLRAIDRENEADYQRALIWIVDIGLRDETKSSQLAYLNIEKLAAEFRALKFINAARNAPLLKWLHERVIVLVGGLRREEIDRCYEITVPRADMDLPWFVGDRLFLEGVPGRWLEPVEIANTFGRHEGELWRRPTITAHLAAESWELDHDADIDPKDDLRYFIHGELPGRDGMCDTRVAHCIELAQPGWRWSNGFRLASMAAFQRLGWNRFGGGLIDRTSGEPKSISGMEALAQLRRHNFAALRLQEFLDLPDMIDSED